MCFPFRMTHLWRGKVLIFLRLHTYEAYLTAVVGRALASLFSPSSTWLRLLSNVNHRRVRRLLPIEDLAFEACLSTLALPCRREQRALPRQGRRRLRTSGSRDGRSEREKYSYTPPTAHSACCTANQSGIACVLAVHIHSLAFCRASVRTVLEFSSVGR